MKNHAELQHHLRDLMCLWHGTAHSGSLDLDEAAAGDGPRVTGHRARVAHPAHRALAARLPPEHVEPVTLAILAI